MKKQRIFLLAIIFSLSFSNFASAINDPIAHWKLDETSGLIAEDSAGDNDGTLVNGPIWTTGIIDGSLQFDGESDYVEAGDHDSLEPQEFTLSAWVYRGSTSTQDVILQKGSTHVGDNRNGYLFKILQSTCSWPNKVRLWIVINGQHTSFPLSDTQIQTGIWYHVAATYDRSYMRMYVNGSEEGTPILETRAIDYSGGYQEFKIGAQEESHGSLCGHFDGKIDDVRIYNRALSAQEIEELYLGEEAELVGLEITGPNQVPEDSQTQYSAIALYDNNSTADVTDEALWSVEPDVIADINAGLLTTEKIFQPEAVTITAQYSEDGNTFDANKPVSLFAICPSGSALQFDGVDDYVAFSENVVTTTEFTIAGWVNNYGEGGGTYKINKLFVQRDDDFGDNQSAIGLTTDNGVNAKTSIRSSSGSIQTLAAPRKPYNEWHHYTITVDSTDFIFYIDGVEVDRTLVNQGGNYWTSIDHVYIGRNSYSGTPLEASLNGSVDDVCIYNRALSAQEIQMIMHVPLEGDEPNLIGYWDFDEGSGQVAYDTSGNGNDGQLGSAPDIDDSDPNWVDSDAPVGICTLEELVERNVNEALEIKLNILDEILEALAREDASVNILDGLFGELEYGYLDKTDIRRASREIHSAIQSEEQAMQSVEKSVGDLENSLEILTSEDVLPDSNSSNDNRLMKRLLIPLEK